jgi:predicted acylesterase/phospholipase RssA
MVPNRIGLALSGGGFRATMFHLGVVRFLADSGLLAKIPNICSVSGGSILAAHVSQTWAAYVQGGDVFKTAAKRVVEAIETGLRERVIIRLPFVWLFSWLPYCGRFNATWLLKRQYNQLLFKGAGFDTLDMMGARLHLLSTNLTNPKSAFCFTAQHCEHHPNQGAAPFGPGAYELAGGVAASSAFPGIFPPLQLRPGELGAAQGDFGGSRIFLTDGGVYDNLGIRALRDLHKTVDFDLMLISDAGAKQDAMYDTNYLWTFNYVPRLIDVMGERIRSLESVQADPAECICSIHTVINGSPVDLEIQGALGKVRTDLDAFSPLLIRSLVVHGQIVARAAVVGFLRKRVDDCHADLLGVSEALQATPVLDPQDQASCQRVRELQQRQTALQDGVAALETAINHFAAIQHWEPYHPVIPSFGDLRKDREHVIAARKRPWKLSAILRDPAGLAMWIGFMLLLGAAVWFGWSGATNYVRDAILHPRRGDFGHDAAIKLDSEVASKSTEIFPPADPQKPESIRRAGLAFGWQQLVSNLAKQQGQGVVYVMRQEQPFAVNLNPFPAVLGFEVEGVNPKIIDGVAYLREDDTVDGRQVPQYRQINFRRDGEGKIIGNGLVIDNANKGEYLWMIVLIEGNGLPTAGPELKGFRVRRE